MHQSNSNPRGPKVELNPKPKKIPNFGDFGTLKKCMSKHLIWYTVFSIRNSPGSRHDDSSVVPDVVRYWGSGVSDWKRFSPGFSQRFSLDSLSLSKDVFSFFVTGSSTCSSTSSLEWNRDWHPQYSHLLIVLNKQRALFNAWFSLYTFP